MPTPPPRVYVETTVVSYLTSRRSRDLLVAARQQVTAEWWERAAEHFELVTSAVVVDEAGAGDPAMAARRLALLDGLRALPVTPDTRALAHDLLRAGALPAKALGDALHLAVAAVGRADFLATWNLRHLAGPTVRRRLERELLARGHEPPTLCTPEALAPGTSTGDPDA